MGEKALARIVQFPELTELRWGTDDMNLAEFPLSVLGERPPSGVKTLIREDTKWDTDRKRLFQRRLIITAADYWGLPAAGDSEVLLALIHLTKERNGFTEPRVRFSVYEVLRLLGWAMSGDRHNRVVLAIRRWCGVSLTSEKAWWDKAEQEWRSSNFGILTQADFSGRRGRAAREEARGEIVWHDFMFQSFRNGYVKPIDMEVFRQLKTPVAKALYRFLDKRFIYRPECNFSLREFAVNKLGLTNYKYESKIRQRLEHGIGELEALGVIKRENRYQEIGRGKYRVHFTQGKKQDREKWEGVKALRASVCEELDVGMSGGLLDDLVRRGVSTPRAKELVGGKSPEALESAIEEFDQKKAKGYFNRKGSNAGAWLFVRARDGSAPEGYVPRSVRKQRAEKQEKVKKEEEKEADEEAQEGEAARLRTKARVKEYLAGMSEDALQALILDAMQSEDEPTYAARLRKSLHSKSNRQGHLWRTAIERYIERTAQHALND